MRYPILEQILADAADAEEHNAYLFTHDPMLVRMYDAAETIEMFGEDMLKEHGVYIPPEIIKRYKAWEAEMKELQNILDDFKKKQDKWP